MLPKNDMIKQYRKLYRGEFIMVFVDTSGEGSDWNAAQFMAKDKLDIPIVLHYQGSITDVTPELKVILEKIHELTGVPPCVCYETNNGGGYELERLNRLNKFQKYTIYKQYTNDNTGRVIRSDKLGWNTNSATRKPMMIDIQDAINNRLIRIYHKPTIEEMFSFVKHKTPSGWKAEAETGSHDDLIMSLAGVYQLYQTEQPLHQDEEYYEEESLFNNGFYA